MITIYPYDTFIKKMSMQPLTRITHEFLSWTIVYIFKCLDLNLRHTDFQEDDNKLSADFNLQAF